MTGRSLSALGFLQIYRNKRAEQRKFYAYIFSEQLFGENICLKFPLLGSFIAINLKKPQTSQQLSAALSKENAVKWLRIVREWFITYFEA